MFALSRTSVAHMRDLAILAVLFLAPITDAAAQDQPPPPEPGQRSGFIFGFGVGAALEMGAETYYLRNGAAVAVDLKLGHTVSRSLELFFEHRAHFKGNEYIDIDIQSTGITGLGAAYMFSPLRLNGLVGLAWTARWDCGYSWDYRLALGFGAGLGYEFAPRWIVSLDISYGIMQYRSPFTIAATVNFLSF